MTGSELSGAGAGETRHAFTGRKLFNVDQANAALPLVRAITVDLARLSCEVSERRERLALLRSGRERASRDLYSDELTQIEEELEKDTERLLGYVEELRALGVDPKNGPEGLIDFPALQDGRPVYLCWKLGEDRVEHWHELEAGFRGRQPVTQGAPSDSANAGPEAIAPPTETPPPAPGGTPGPSSNRRNARELA